MLSLPAFISLFDHCCFSLTIYWNRVVLNKLGHFYADLNDCGMFKFLHEYTSFETLNILRMHILPVDA